MSVRCYEKQKEGQEKEEKVGWKGDSDSDKEEQKEEGNSQKRKNEERKKEEETVTYLEIAVWCNEL